MLNIKLLEKLTSIPSPSGYTFQLTTYLEEYLKHLGYTPFKNKKGNLFVEVKGKSEYKIALSAHIDTLGLMIRSIDNSGRIMFTSIGGPAKGILMMANIVKFTQEMVKLIRGLFYLHLLVSMSIKMPKRKKEI